MRKSTKQKKSFFTLGNELQEQRERVAIITEVVNDNLQKLDVDLREIRWVKSHLVVDCNAHLVQTLHFYQQLQEYVGYLNSFTRMSNRAAPLFCAYKIALLSNLSSLAASYVTPRFLPPNQPASIVNVLANDEIFHSTILFPAIRVGREAIYHEIQLVSEVSSSFQRPFSSSWDSYEFQVFYF